jgi:hypothetical protein
MIAELGLGPMSFSEIGMSSGLPHLELAECPRPVTALADVRKVANDFVILRTLGGGLREMLELFDWRELLAQCRLRFLADSQVRLCVQALSATGPMLVFFDEQLRRRVEMRVDASAGYAKRAGVEVPRAGLAVVKVWEDTHDVSVIVETSIVVNIRLRIGV